jgi:flagellar biogenesis protein FliO
MLVQRAKTWSVMALVCGVTLAGIARGEELQGPPAPGDETRQQIAERERQPLFPTNARLESGPARSNPAAGSASASRAASAESRGWVDLVAMAGPLALVIGLILLAAGILKRVARSTSGSLASALGPGGQAPSGVLDVLGRFPIARGQTLVLFRLDRRVLLVAHTLPTRSSPGGFTTLAELSDPDEVASLLIKARDGRGESVASQFAEVAARMERGELGEREADEQRRVQVSAGGDSTRLWRDDPTAIPPFAARTHAVPPEAAMSIKSRLAALRGRSDNAGQQWGAA